jgi:hypothetical protein
MKKTILAFSQMSLFSLLLSGCSLFYTDHSSDYQNEKAVASSLKTPEGSTPSKDILVIPNEESIADLESVQSFETPRAQFIYYPMVAVGVTEKDNAIQLSVPTNKEQTKRIVTDFLAALYGAGESVRSQTEDEITSVSFDFHPQGWWASLWSDITRLHPPKTVFLFKFTEVEGKTLVDVQFRDEQEGLEPTEWMSPVKDDDAHTIAVRLWGTVGRQLNQSSAYLSSLGDAPDFPVWVNHRGIYAVRLGNKVSPSDIEAKLNAAGVYIMPDAENMLAPVKSEDIARIGDVIDFTIPTGNGEKQKLFNVYRRDLDDVNWDKREYSYKITHQKAGDFLVIDVSSMDYPEVTSFHLVQRFIKQN